MKSRVIAIEEHYWDSELRKLWSDQDAFGPPPIAKRMQDWDLRLMEMDEAGIDMQVLSQAPPSVQKLDAETAIRVARGVNDRLAEMIRAHPARFAGFATLPTQAPQAAADELARCVSELGFKGAMLHGLTDGIFPDDRRFWPIYARAQALDVPVYLHPSIPDAAVTERYYADYVRDFPMILGPAWAFAVETGTAALRMVLSGVFETYPGLKIILGHLGEGIPFMLQRIDESLSRTSRISFRDIFCRHFWITTSGNFSTSALLCSAMEMGIDRILFSVDYPYVMNKPGVEWMATVPLSPDDRKKVLHGNAARLLKI